MKKFRIIIAGSRSYDDYNTLAEECDRILSLKVKDADTEIVVVSGHASGADALGERYAQERGFGLETFPADWTKFGRAAGPVRNAQMASVAHALIAFPKAGEQNRGTKNMVDLAVRKGLQIRIIGKI